MGQDKKQPGGTPQPQPRPQPSTPVRTGGDWGHKDVAPKVPLTPAPPSPPRKK